MYELVEPWTDSYSMHSPKSSCETAQECSVETYLCEVYLPVFNEMHIHFYIAKHFLPAI